MTESKQRTKPASMPVITVPKKEYRLTREDYPELQRARGLVKLQKLKAAEYTNDQGLQDLRIVYKLRDTVFTAENLTSWGKIIGEQLLAKIEAWTPNESVYALSEMLSTMKFCNPAIEADITTLPTEKIHKKLKNIIVIQDSAGFGINKSGTVVNCDEILQSIEQAERLGMTFTKKE
jgi:hypothetical protein